MAAGATGHDMERLRGKPLTTLVCAVFVVAALQLSATAHASAQTPPPPPRPGAPANPQSPAPPRPQDQALVRGTAHLDSRLVQAAHEAAGRPMPAAASVIDSLPRSGSRVRVEIVADPSSTGSVRAAVEAAGGAYEREYDGVVQAIVPPAALDGLSNRPGVSFIRPPFQPYADAVTDEGVNAISGASVWRSAGLSGIDVKVAVIDLGFGGLANRQASGDVPANATVVDFCGDGNINGTSHGTAVAEIVSKVAPAAQLYLLYVCSAVGLGQATDYAIAQGVTVVNHSVAWMNTSRGDGTGGAGTPDAIVASARANGILWVNAAGNYRYREHWNGTFTDSDGDGWLNFAGADETNDVSIGNGAQVCGYMKWDAWPTTSIDYDLYLLRSSDLSVLAVSASDQSTGTSPTEAVCYTNNTGATLPAVFAIYRYAGSGTPRIDFFAIGAGLQYSTEAGSVTEPASSPSAMAVGALCYLDSSLEYFSSAGPTIDGRVKPDIAGFDSVSTATYGASSGCAGGFAGTSAASPHVAGVAALVKQAYPSWTPAQVQSFLEGRATDLGAAGKDSLYGAGALALGAIPTGVPSVVSVTPSSGTVTPGTPTTFTVVANDTDGTANLWYIEFDIHDETLGDCVAVYDRTLASLQILTGTGWTNAGPPGSGTTVVGTNCTLYGGTSTLTTSGTDTSVGFRLALANGFTGQHSLRVFTSDVRYEISGWVTSGTITSSTAPTVGAFSAPANIATGEATGFLANYADADGVGTIAYAYLTVAGSPSGPGCLLRYDVGNNVFQMWDGSAWTGSAAPLSAPPLVGSNCTLDASHSFVSSSSALMVYFVVSFPSASALNVYAGTTDTSGLFSGWVGEGAITIHTASAAPSLDSITPSAGSVGAGVPTDIVVAASDPDGGNTIRSVSIYLGTLGACQFTFTAPSTWSVDTGSPAQCQLSVAQSSAVVSGTQMTVRFHFTIVPPEGQLYDYTVYAYVTDATYITRSARGTLTMTAPTAPTTVSVTPSSSTMSAGDTVTLTGVYRDVNGAYDLSQMYLVVASSAGGGGCYLRYDLPTNTLRVGSSIAGTPGSGSPVASTECTLDPATTTVSVAGTDVTVAFRVSLAAAIAGSQNVYLVASDVTGRATGWDNRGSITINAGAAAPTTVSVTPSTGTVNTGDQIMLTAVYRDGNGAATLSQVYLVVADAAGGRGCYVRYLLSGTSIQVANASGSWLSAGTPGSGSTTPGANCTLYGGSSSVGLSATDLTLGARLSFSAGFTGVHSIFLIVSDESGLASGWDNQGSISVVSPPTAPTTVSVAPSTAAPTAGDPVSLDATFDDANGGTTFWQVYVVVANAVGGGGCYLRYDQGTNLLQVLDGGAWATAGTPGSGSATAGTNCTLDAVHSSASTSGTELRVLFGLSFAPAFVGTHNVYLVAADAGGLASGWDNRGSLTVSAPATAPTTVSVSPGTLAVPAGTATTLTAAYDDANGGGTFWQAYLVVADAVGGGGCYLRYDQGGNVLQVLNAGTWTTAGAPGGGSAAVGTNCTLDSTASTVTVSGTGLTVAFRVSFASGFSGGHTVYLIAADATGLATGWDVQGSLTVGAAPTAPTTVSVSPNSSTISVNTSTTLTAVYDDANGGDTFWQVYLVVADAVGGPGCYLQYDQGANVLRVLSGGTWLTAGAPGSGTATAGSNCTLDPAASTVAVSGTTLTIGFRASFTAGGAHSVFLVAVDATGLATYWDNRGSITVGAAPTAPTTVSVSPASASAAAGAATTLTAVYDDANGGDTFWQVYVVVSDAVGGAGCYLQYDQGANLLRVLSGGTWVVAGAPGSGNPTAGTNCTLDPSGSSVSVSGTTLTVGYRVSFPAVGTHSVFLIAVDATGRATYWDDRGTISVG